MPSTRFTAALAALALATLPGLAAAQRPPAVQFSLTTQFAIAFGYSFAVGALMLAADRRWVDGVASEARRDPVVSVAVGSLGYYAAAVGFALLAITIVGIVVTIPGLLGLFVLALVGTPLGAYTAGRVLTDAGGAENRWLALFVGTILIGAVSAVPLVGGLLNTLVASPGVGVLMLRTKRRLLD
ncbi:hypothetical protein [Haloarcula nitratireducens]|uniref:DUF8173 domain-containing protein n=1 Tax=Haloarcula nitratireducens TaxID=2487749 RepID=A0AAW4PCC5_9EURY|nr:hypothetical protein [Halomicroarcula nitratireducens]MBX0295851.1 hypothetical protein [Halomicroarcula nitratireducens]